jgi:Zn-dependent protease
LPPIDFGALFISFLVLLFSLTVHESAHAWTADRLGDPTARRLGRISLNPVVHVDPFGTILLPLLAFTTGAPVIGWAKPVPVNIRNLRRQRRDYVLVAAAGPASNLVLALGASMTLRAGPVGPAGLGEFDVGGPLVAIAALAFQLNLLLAVFNMIPIPPLDGGNVLSGLLPDPLAQLVDRVRPFGFLLLYALMLTGTLGALIGPPYLFLSRLLQP